MFSQTWQVCSTLFWLSCRILIHAGSMPLYLSQSLVLLTPLSWEIQMQSRIARTCLILNSSCHGGHLKRRWFQIHPYFLGKSLWGRHISSQRHLSDFASLSIMSFHSAISKQSFSCEVPVASAGPSKHSELTVLTCCRTGCFYFCVFQEWPSRYVLDLSL